MAQILNSISAAAELIISRNHKNVLLATPLGLGKPNTLLNRIYESAKADPEINLKIFTALSLNPPAPKEDLAKRFFEPFARRQWGADYPCLKYAEDAEKNLLPKNVRVHEFYFRAGSALKSSDLQRDYQSINYTHVAESLFAGKINTVVQMIAKHPTANPPKFSLSCNPDVTIDLVELFRTNQRPILVVGVVHEKLPYLEGEAEVSADFFDLIVEDPGLTHELFGLPRLPVSSADQVLGFYASQLVADNGTLQIGIGSLSDAVVAAVILRHENNSLYQEIFKKSWRGLTASPLLPLENRPFTEGVYGLSEMVTDGYMHLHNAGILKRVVVDEKSQAKTYLHGAFVLGSKNFYAWLRGLTGGDMSGLRMTRVSKVNDLYDPHEITLRRQRINPRFINTCMQVTLLGGAVSETLPDGNVVSGVGGQYNFVAMAQELKNSRSILMLRSTREAHGKRKSNIVWSASNLTIPRHLRDVVVTEYGIADLKNKTDEECIMAMLEITDSEFQEELKLIAQKCGKLSKSYQVPPSFRKNNSEQISELVRLGRTRNFFKTFPLGSDFTPAEEKLSVALSDIQSVMSQPLLTKVKYLFRTLRKTRQANNFTNELDRMKLGAPKSLKDRLYRKLLIRALTDLDPQAF